MDKENSDITADLDIFDLWAKCDHITLGLAPSTYDAQLRRVKPLHLDGSTMVLQAASAGNRDWLDRRLKSQIERGLSHLAGLSLTVRFELPPAEAAPVAAPPPEREPEPPATGDDLAGLDLAAAGWSKHLHYLTRFYRAYIGAPAFDMWDYIRSHCKDSKAIWTPPHDFTGAGLARGAGCSYQKVVGVWRTCKVFDQTLLETGEILPACCGKYRNGGDDWPDQVRPSEAFPQGRPACRFWVHGALELLEAEGLAVWTKHGDAPRNTFYTIQIYQYPPLLAPKQAERLDKSLRIEHRRFLRGLLSSQDKSLSRWQADESYSLLPQKIEHEGLDDLTLPLPDDGVLRAAARNNIFFASTLCADGDKRTE